MPPMWRRLGSVDEAFERLRALPHETVAGAVDHDADPAGGPEVNLGKGKTAE